MIRRLAGELGAKVVFYANPDTQVVLRAMCRRPGKMLPATFRDMNDWEDIPLISKDLKTNDMPIFISSRKSTASYNPLFEQIPQTLANYFSNNSYMVLYPEQQTGGPDMDVLLMDIPPASTTWSFLARCKRLAKRLLKLDKE
jgi:hypothetical protein